jgi:HEPN domain-containing protein
MKPKRFPPDDPREWIRRAKSNLARARAYQTDVDCADFCFDAQQCKGLKIPKYLGQAKELTRYAFGTRYPGPGSEVTERQYRRAVRIATAVLGWSERQIGAERKGSGGKT